MDARGRKCERPAAVAGAGRNSHSTISP